jgi:hypothetical protein
MSGAKKPKILHSASYWQEFHRNRAKRRARTVGASGGMSSSITYDAPGAFQAQSIITFIPNRAAPVYTHVQNNGSLAWSYDPLCIQSAPPPNADQTRGPTLPAKYEPLPPPVQIAAQGHRRAIAERTQQLLATNKKPSEDEQLLERLRRRREAYAGDPKKKTVRSGKGKAGK